MPTYEYLCRSCGDHLEVVQSFADDALTVCDACGGELRKIFSAAGLIFKGSGWHVKDYASGAKGAAGTSSSSTSAKDGPTDGSKGPSSSDTPSGGSESGSKSQAKSETAGSKKDAASTSSSASSD